jgi:hypothetical protein
MKPTIVVHPDADLFITGSSWGRLEVAAYDAKANVLVPVGTISLKGCKGKTLSKYNWEAHINSKK